MVVLTGTPLKLLDQFIHLADGLPVPGDPIPEPTNAASRTHARQKRLGPAAQVELMRAYQSGQSMYALAHHFDIRTSTVSGILRRSGIPIREQRTFGDADLQAATDLYEQGLSLAKVGDRLGFDTETVRKHLRRNGVQIRPRPGRPVVPRLPAPGAS